MNMKRLRALRGLSQARLAENMEISTSHVAEIELENRFPSPDTLVTMARVLGVTPSLLLMGPEESMLFEEFKKRRSMYQEVARELLDEIRGLLGK